MTAKNFLHATRKNVKEIGRPELHPEMRLFFILLFLLLMIAGAQTCSAAPSFAFFYAANPPTDELKAFDIVVVDPGSGISPARFGKNSSELFAYVSVGETGSGSGYAKLVRKSWIIGRNKGWNSMVMDTSSASWRRFFLDRVIDPLWKAGYRGFFLDTLDSYQLAVGKDRYAEMEDGMVMLIREIKNKYPGARLIFNRGFEIVDRLRSDVFAVAAESLFNGYSPSEGGYYKVGENDRNWLLGRLNHLKNEGIPVISIDYVRPGMREEARVIAGKIRSLGFVPWVTDKDLSSLGVGSVEVMPRKILGLYDGRDAPDPVYTNLLRFAALPLNYMGYTLEMHDMRKPLPDMILEGRYAGVVVWPSSDSSAGPEFREWLSRAIGEGVKVVFLDYFGIPAGELPKEMGIRTFSPKNQSFAVHVLAKDGMMGFESQPHPQADCFPPVRMEKGKVVLKIADESGNVSDAAGITSWGGYVLNPFTVLPDFGGQTAWEVDPFKFFREALRLPDMPVPDTTTENGVRLLMVHVDGDGFASRAEWPGGGYSGTELRRNILEKFRIASTISVITGIVAPNGIYPDKSAEFEKIAREIYRLPWIEAGSHSFSHPFKWLALENDNGGEGDNLNIPGYTFNVNSEIKGSIDFINSRLLPRGKRVRVFQWTGNCVPGADAIEEAYREGVANINGGDTTITKSSRSITAVAPLGVAKNGWFQVFAPNQNENIYTNLWQSDFYGYHRVLETFRLTDSPRRLKPVDIYYHFYSATKKASLKALDQIYSWAVGNRLNSVFTSEYAGKVLDFNRTVVARTDGGWLIRNAGDLREIRIPRGMGYPDVSEGTGVAGFSDYGDVRYIHLAPGGEAKIRLQPGKTSMPYVAKVNGILRKFGRDGKGISLTIHGWLPECLLLGNAGKCRLFEGNTALLPAAATGGEATFKLAEGTHELRLECR